MTCSPRRVPNSEAQCQGYCARSPKTVTDRRENLGHYNRCRFVENVFRKTIGVLSCGKQCTQYGPLKTHVVVKVFHVDNGMCIGDSSRRRYVRRTSPTGERVKGDHDGSEFSHTRHYVTTTAAGELIDCIVQFRNYRGKIHQLRLVRCTDMYGSRMEIASYATLSLIHI